MSTVRKAEHVTCGSAMGVLTTIAIAKTLTALVMSFPITWLVRHIFAGAAVRFVFAEDGFSYWRCMGLFLIWFTARVRIQFSGPALVEIEGDR